MNSQPATSPMASPAEGRGVISIASCRYQRGTALIMSLVILMILTILCITAMGTALLEEKMSGNTQESTRSFQAAESGLIQVFNTATNYDVNSSQTNNFTYGSGKAEVVTEFVQYTTPRRSTTANSAVQFESANFNHKSTGTTTVGAKAVINLGVAQLVPKSN